MSRLLVLDDIDTRLIGEPTLELVFRRQPLARAGHALGDRHLRLAEWEKLSKPTPHFWFLRASNSPRSDRKTVKIAQHCYITVDLTLLQRRRLCVRY